MHDLLAISISSVIPAVRAPYADPGGCSPVSVGRSAVPDRLFYLRPAHPVTFGQTAQVAQIVHRGG